MQAAALDRAIAQQATCALGELGARGPADVAASGTLVEGRGALAAADRAAVAAAQALHLPETSIHGLGIDVRNLRINLERGMFLPAGPGDQLVPAAELDAGAAVRLSAGALLGIDRLPARVRHVLNPSRREQLVDALGRHGCVPSRQ